MESIDREIYTATENSDIPIIKDDGTVDSLQNIIDENLQREEIASHDADDVYTATPISDIPIVQEDGSVDTLESIMNANEQADIYRATPISEIPIVQEDGSIDTLKNIMDKNMEEHIKEPDCVPELSVEEIMDSTLIENGPSEAAKRELELLRNGSRAINARLEVKADDYRDKGYSEDEIEKLLEADKIAYQTEFLTDTFPGQDVSTAVFRHIDEE